MSRWYLYDNLDEECAGYFEEALDYYQAEYEDTADAGRMRHSKVPIKTDNRTGTSDGIFWTAQ